MDHLRLSEIQKKKEEIPTLLLARLGSLVGLAMPESIPSTSGGSMGFPKYRLNRATKLDVCQKLCHPKLNKRR